MFQLQGRRVFIAGHHGMVGGALTRRLESARCEILTVPRKQLDLRNQSDTHRWFEQARPDVVFAAAATVGGILANDTRPAEFLYDNLLISSNIIEGARQVGVKKLLILGSSCIYPKFASQPIAEDALLTGSLEPTNQWYAIAKIAGLKLCAAYRRQYGCDFIAAQPTNLYGPGDTYDLFSSHVIPSLIMKTHVAKSAGLATMEVWGSGRPRREFLYVEDLADALVFLMEHYSAEEHINVGCGQDLTIAELAQAVADVVGYRGSFDYLADKPDGTPQKLLDVSKLSKLGWAPRTELREGLAQTYDWFLKNIRLPSE